MEEKNNYLNLTKIDCAILDSYAALLPNLGDYLGEGYEIILHSLENLHHSVIKIINGHYSGRTEGAPITDLALAKLGKIEKDQDHSAITYLNKSKKGVTLRSSTIPITGERGRIIGLLCINYYTDVPVSSLLDKFNLARPSIEKEHQLTETFAENTDELIISALEGIRDSILNDTSISLQNKNKEIIIALYHKGIFNIKDSVIKVAELLQISKNTVYMHLRNLKS